MSLNIFQLLKQGTSLKRENLSRLTQIQSILEVKHKEANHEFQQTGRFNASDSEIEEEHDLDEKTILKNQHKAKEDGIVLKKLHNIKVFGNDIPQPLNNFTKIIQKYKLKQCLVNNMGEKGYQLPTPVQMQVLPCLLENRSVLVTAPTGSGKTLAFSLPLVQHLQHQKLKIQALILAPFHELAEQILQEVQSLAANSNLEIVSIGSNLKKQQRLRQGRKITADILIATPMTLINLFKERQQLLDNIKYVIMDECDKYFEESFLEQIKTILSFFQNKAPLFGLFSATIQFPVEQLLQTELLEDSIRIQVGGKNNVLQKISQKMEYCSNQYGKLVQIRNLIHEGRFIPPVLMFVQSKERAKELFFQMRRIFKETMQCVNRVEYITADKGKEERDAILERYQKGELWTLIATDLIARGIDFRGVNLVINYDFPTTMLTYIHRVGRTGRGQRTGNAITFYTDEDKGQLRSLANLLKVSGCEVPSWIFELKAISKKERRKLVKHPTSRESISLDPKNHVDHNWRRQMSIVDRRFMKKLKKEQEQKQNDDDGWQVVT